MLIRISNIGDATVLLQQHGAPDLELPRGRSVVIEDAVLVAEGAAPVAAAPAIASSVPPEGIARSPAATPPVVLPDGFIAGSESGGPGHPIDPVPIKDRPEPANNGKTTEWDPNGNPMAAMLPPAKRQIYSDFG
ncbi:MAG TPA: hypothetical protein VMF32_25375 [Xanthobacteraceae bacterium]|nr:hypothetical protein [Xanthobacteraceae bacterium]